MALSRKGSNKLLQVLEEEIWPAWRRRRLLQPRHPSKWATQLALSIHPSIYLSPPVQLPGDAFRLTPYPYPPPGWTRPTTRRRVHPGPPAALDPEPAVHREPGPRQSPHSRGAPSLFFLDSSLQILLLLLHPLAVRRRRCPPVFRIRRPRRGLLLCLVPSRASRCAGLPRRRRGCPPHSCREPELRELANPEAAALVSFGCPELLIIWLQWSDWNSGSSGALLVIPMGSNDPSTPSKASKPSEQEQHPATTSGTTAPVYPEWPGFQGYSAMPPHGFFPPPVAAGQAHPYMWGAQHMVPPYGTPPPPYMMYPPGTVYAHPSTPGVHPFHYPMAANGNVEPAVPGAAPGASEMNGKNEPGRTSGPSANGVTSNSESGSDSESEGSDANSQNDSHSKDNDVNENGSAQNGVSHSSSHGIFNKTMPLVPVQSGAVIGGVAGPATNLNIGMDYWGATASSPVPAMRSKVPSGSARGEQWDERELKKQKRKLSNRESARRSRLRKQAECEELGQRAEALKSENSSLRIELERIKKEYEELLLKNTSLKEKLGGSGGDPVPDMNERNDTNGSHHQEQKEA